MSDESNVCYTSSCELCAPVPMANEKREEEKEKNFDEYEDEHTTTTIMYTDFDIGCE